MAQPSNPPDAATFDDVRAAVGAPGSTQAGGVAALPPPLDSLDGEHHSAPIARTAAALLSVQGITWLSSLVNILAVPRFLGASDFGILSIAATGAMPVTLIVGFGATNHLVKVVARNPADAASAVLHVVAARVVFFLAAMLVIAPITYLLVGDARERAVVLIVFLSAGFSLVASAATAALQGNQTLGRAALATALIGIAGQFMILVMLLGGGGLLAVAGAGAIVALASAVATFWLFWAALGKRVSLSWREAKRLVAAGLPFLAWDAALFLLGSTGLLVLGLLAGSKTAGEYAFAYRLATIPFFFTTIVGAALFPSFASSIQQQIAWTRSAISNALRILTVVTLPLACGMALMASDLGHIAGGDKFAQAGLLVPVIALSIPLISIDTVLGTALMARDLQGAWARVGWLASVFNVAVNFALIPICTVLFGRPALGTALAMILTELLMATFAWAMMRAYIDFHRVLRELGATVLACICLAAAFLLVKPLGGLVPAIAAAAVAFIAVAFLLNAARLEDARWVRRSLIRNREAGTSAI